MIAVKENRKGLYEDIKDYFEGMEGGEIAELPGDIWQGEEERGHGRIERREIRTVTGLEWLERREAWEDVMDFTPAEENEDGKETGPCQTPHDVRRPKFGFPV